MDYFMAILCGLGLSAGQLLFKLCADFWQRSGSLFDFNTLITLTSALALYGVATLGWIWVLQTLELGQVYPLMALTAVFIPIGSYFIFGERFGLSYFIGGALIILGVIVIV